MKKINKYMLLLLVALMGISLTSCNDAAIAETLEGTWKGTTYMAEYYSGKRYDATYSEVDFSIDPFKFTKGSGHWVDYYDQHPWGSRDYVANHITWEVKDHVIYIHFEEDNYDLWIDRYSLNNNYFDGYIYFDKDTDFAFRLDHVSSPNWNNYNWGWNYMAPAKDGKAPEQPQRCWTAPAK